MKKTLIAFAALTAIAGAAQAQSTVTLYGIGDLYAGQKQTTNRAGVKVKNTVVDSGGLNTSRFGMRGSEDLGAGLKAIFTLEAGLDIDTGAANLNGGGLFSRQAFAGLSGNFGTATLGRQYTSMDQLRDATNNTYDANYFETTTRTFGNGVVDYSPRTANSFAYATPVFSGFSATVVLGTGEDKTATASASRNNSFHIKYANGPLLVGYAYQNEKFNAGPSTLSNPVGGTTAAGTGERDYNYFGASYDFGVARVTGGYNIAKQENATVNGEDKEYQFGVSVPFGAASVAAGYTRSKSDTTNAKGTGYSLIGTYDLSKRTRLYVGGKSEKFTVGAVARNSGVVAGVRHAF
jgi:predicted porin